MFLDKSIVNYYKDYSYIYFQNDFYKYLKMNLWTSSNRIKI